MTFEKMYWADLETLGLSEDSAIIEISLAVTDIELRIIDEISIPVWSGHTEAQVEHLTRKGGDWAIETHTRTGLLEHARAEGVYPHEAERRAIDWLAGHGIEKGDPLCGASVHADRMWMKEQMDHLIEAWGYRHIDVSSFKEACRRFNPRMFEYLNSDVMQKIEDAYGDGNYVQHVGVWDLRWTIFEMRWYYENFLFVDPLSDQLDG